MRLIVDCQEISSVLPLLQKGLHVFGELNDLPHAIVLHYEKTRQSH